MNPVELRKFVPQGFIFSMAISHRKERGNYETRILLL